MQHKYIYSLLIIMISLLSEVKAQNTVYTGGSPVQITIIDDTKNYIFTAPQIRGRYNSTLKRFEFLMAVRNVSSKSNNSFLLSLFDFIFHPDQAEEVNMFVYLPNETRSFEGFINPKTLVLTGQVEIAGKSYQLPVTMNLKYTNNTLYYGLQGQLTSDFGMVAVADNEEKIWPREVQILIPESPMGIFIED